MQELRKIEGPRPKAIPDWPRCTNCGEQYGPLAINPHMKRCVKLLPHGANGYGPQDHHKDPRFAHIYKAAQVDLKEEAPTLAESVGGALSSLGKSMASLLKALGPQLDDAELSRLRKLFDRFDANTDELLDEDEFGLLLRNCFPTRVADADAVVDEFASADADGSGEVTFEEFVKHYLEMKQVIRRLPHFNPSSPPSLQAQSGHRSLPSSAVPPQHTRAHTAAGSSLPPSPSGRRPALR